LNREYAGRHVVLRSDKVINSLDRVKAAKVINKVYADTNNVMIDSNCSAGTYYYAVLSENMYRRKKPELYRDVNYTSAPVNIYGSDLLFKVDGISVLEIEDNLVHIKWRKIDRSGILYSIYRSKEVLDTAVKLEKAGKIKVLADKGEYIDDGILESGTYYYAVTAQILNGRENRTLIPDENFTTVGLVIEVKGTYAPRSMIARGDKDSVLVEWTITGTRGNRKFRLFRSPRLVTIVDELTEDNMLAEVDLSSKNYRDGRVPEGKFYYGLMPVTKSSLKGYRFIRGVNITSYAVGVREPTDTEDKTRIVDTSDLDRILKRTYFKGKFRSAVKELQSFVNNTDNEYDIAKARLFIGRSYIDQGKYRKALNFLVLSDVKKYFPGEARFWQEFALTWLQ
jgi:hypothetical protein